MSSKLTQIREQFRVNLKISSNDNNNNHFIDTSKVVDRNKYQIKSELKTSYNVPKLSSSSIPTYTKAKNQYVPVIHTKKYSTSSQLNKNNNNLRKNENPNSSVKSINKQRSSYPIAKKFNDQDFKAGNKNISSDSKIIKKPNFYINKTDELKSYNKVNKLSNNFGEKARQLKTIVNDNLKSLKVSEDDTLCRYCKRSFVPQDRLQKHENVCLSAYGKQRYKFDSTKQRFKGKPTEYLLSYESALKDENDDKNDSKRPNWRDQHELLLATIRSVKDENGNGSTYSRMVAATQEACNYCKRRFNSDALKRHLPICAKLYHKKVMIGDRVFRN